jgi:hypothetical protein
MLIFCFLIFNRQILHTIHALCPKMYQKHLRYAPEMPTFYQNYLAMSNTVDMIGGKFIAIWSQSISGVCAINPLVVFYDIHGWKTCYFWVDHGVPKYEYVSSKIVFFISQYS